MLKETETITTSQCETGSISNKMPRKVLLSALARGSDCNYSLTCELCLNEFTTLHQLYNHMSSHLKTDLERKYKDLMDGLKCIVCGQMFKAKRPLLEHIWMQAWQDQQS